MALKVFPLKLGPDKFQNFVYVACDVKTNDALLIDPSWNAPAIINELERNELRLQSILVTHTHSDHVSALDDVLSKFRCPVVMTDYEAKRIEFTHKDFKSCSIEKEFKFGSISFEAMSTPGHTPGSVCYLVGEALFTGDTLFLEGCGDCSSPEGSVDQMWDTINYLKNTLKPNYKIYPGHQYKFSPGLSFNELSRINMYLRFNNKDTFKSFASRKNLKGQDGL